MELTAYGFGKDNRGCSPCSVEVALVSATGQRPQCWTTTGSICNNPVSSVYTEANEAALEERRLKITKRFIFSIYT